MRRTPAGLPRGTGHARGCSAAALQGGVLLVCLLQPLQALAQNPADRGTRRVTFVNVAAPETMEAGVEYAAGLELKNIGTATWDPSAFFRVSYHWVGATPELSVRDGLRTELGGVVKPGATVRVCARVKAPDRAGTYELQWDLVQDGVVWFSSEAPENLLRRRVTVTTGREAARGAPLWGATLAVATLVAVTAVHFLLAGMWIGRAMRQPISLEEQWFTAVLLGLASLQAVLYGLLFTVGISVWSGTAALLGLHGVLGAVTRFRRADHGTQHTTTAETRETRTVVLLRTIGVTVLLALAMQWVADSPASLSVDGTDAAHYHVPHAVNFLNGAGPFGLIATPHKYPMGASVTAAWFMSATRDTLLVDVTTLPFFILLVVSLAWLARLTTGRDGFVVASWTALLLCSMPLFNVALLMSADLFYAAAFTSTFAALGSLWVASSPDRWLVLAASVGLLLSTKASGVFSAGVLLALFGTAVVVRGLARHHFTWPRRMLARATVFVLVTLAAGGVWTIRNAAIYGSPIAPAGVTLMGVTVFEGATYQSTRYYLSVLDDMRDARYSLTRRFRAHSLRWLGGHYGDIGWVFLAPLVGLAFSRGRSRLRQHGAFGLVVAGFAILALVHAAILMGAPWTSLEWTQGHSLRYLLPFFVLYVALAGCAIVLPWNGSKWIRRIQDGCIGAAAAYCGWRFAGGVRINLAAESSPLLRGEYLGLATLLVLLMLAARMPRMRRGVLATAGVVALALSVVFSQTAAAAHQQHRNRTVRQLERAVVCQPLDTLGDSDARKAGLLLERHWRGSGEACVTKQIFVASRLDTPLELQTLDLRSVVFDLTSVRAHEMMRAAPPPGTCAYLVADAGSDEEEFSDRLGLNRRLQQIGRSGRYVLFDITDGQARTRK